MSRLIDSFSKLCEQTSTQRCPAYQPQLLMQRDARLPVPFLVSTSVILVPTSRGRLRSPRSQESGVIKPIPVLMFFIMLKPK